MVHLIISSKDIRTLDGLYSLNDLHKAAGDENKHHPNYFLNNQHTKGLLAEIELAEIPAIKAKDNWGQSKIKLENPPFKPSHIKGFGGCSTHSPPPPTSNSSA